MESFRSDKSQKCRKPKENGRGNSAMRVDNFEDEKLKFLGATLQGMSSKYIVVVYEDGLSSVSEIRDFVNETHGAEKVVGELMMILKKSVK